MLPTTLFLQIIDEDGTDRTPKPLLAVNPAMMRAMNVNTAESARQSTTGFSDVSHDRYSSMLQGHAGHGVSTMSLGFSELGINDEASGDHEDDDSSTQAISAGIPKVRTDSTYNIPHQC